MAERHHHVVCVTAFVPDGSGRLLLVRPNRRGWEMPGGRVEPGEDVAEAAVREVEEETGCEVAVEALLGIECRISDPEVLFVRFRCRYLRGSPRPSAETPEVGWFTYDEARSMITEEPPASRLADALSGSDQILIRRFTSRPYDVRHQVELGPR